MTEVCHPEFKSKNVQDTTLSPREINAILISELFNAKQL